MNDIKVSLICTVKNEEPSIKEFLDSLLSQSKLPDEVIIVDGGSTDRTVDIINSYINKYKNIKLIIKNGANIARGRNIAIQNAKYNIIASTDAGCIIDKQWLKNLIKPFAENQSVDVVSGWYESNAKTETERCIADLTYPKLKKVLRNQDNFLPSSRSIAYKKKCWEKVMGYPEWLYTAEDTLFDLNLKKSGYKFIFVPDAVVYWKVRENLRDVFKQFYLYAEGDGRAGLIFKHYYFAIILYTFGLILLIVGFFAKILWSVLFICILMYLSISILKAYENIKSVNTFIKVPILWLVRDVARIYGYIVGALKRMIIMITQSTKQEKIHDENI